MEDRVKGRREAALDILKLIACAGVIIIHVSGHGLKDLPMGSAAWYGCCFWDCLARFAVPVFFMCTGALMLPPERELDTKRIWSKYILRVLGIMLFWAWAYYVFNCVGTYITTGYLEENWLLNSITETLLFRHHLHLYYLQMLLLLYALLPVMRVYTKSASEKDLRYALIAWLILGIAMPLMIYYFPMNRMGMLVTQYPINMTWSAMGYALLGFAMTRRTPERARLWRYIALFIAGFAFTFAGTAIASLRAGYLNAAFMEGMSPGPAAMAIGLFGAARILFYGRESTKKLARLVKASFAVYLVHHFFVMVFRFIGFDVTLFTPWLEIPFESAVIFALSLAVWWVLSKIPFVKDHLI